MEALRISSKITNRQSAVFKKYLSEIGEIKRFSAEQEAECAIRATNGDKQAMEELIKRNLRFVVSVAKQYEHNGVDLEDLVNEGNIGLVTAAEKYRVDTGFKFISYAVFWIRKIILEFLTKHARSVRLPANKVVNMQKFQKTITNLEQFSEGKVNITDVVKALEGKMTEKEVMDLHNISSVGFDSLDSTVGNGESTTSMYEMIADASFQPTDHLVNSTDAKIEVETILKSLKSRDREIMVMLFGLEGNQPCNLKEVAQKVGLTREMVRQIKEKSLRTLRNAYIS
jgi:RNA polymerase primary sigma factor